MKIHIIRNHATPDQIREMLEELQTYIKLAADVQRNLLAGVNITQIPRKLSWRMVASRRTSGGRLVPRDPDRWVWGIDQHLSPARQLWDGDPKTEVTPGN